MAKDLEMGYLLDFYGEVLTEKQREMLRQYYNDDLSLSEIAFEAMLVLDIFIFWKILKRAYHYLAKAFCDANK